MITMSNEEADKLQVCEMLHKKLIKHKEAAERLKITTRQTKRILKKYRAEGKKGVISKSRGKPSNRRHTEEFRNKIKTLVENEYIGFGPTLAAEKLKEINGISINKESLRRYMINWDLWWAKSKRRCKAYQQRPRREHFGELIQIDGSPHDWFEGRGERCCLIVFIDDATSKIGAMHFAPTETTQAYFECTKKYINLHGVPWSLYSDRHSIFRVNRISAKNTETQFGRAMRELGIKTIFAHSPQAKGRVERANRTLQDRLVKELRLKNISNIDEANKYLEEFVEKHNNRFGKEPMKEADFHRKNTPSSKVLEAIFCERYFRKISKNLEFSFENSIYQVTANNVEELRDTQVVMCKFASGDLKIWHRKKFVECKEFRSRLEESPTATGKDINEIVDKILIADSDKAAQKTQAWHNVPFLRMINRQSDTSVPI